MATKTISITDEAYHRLKSWKLGNESFSDVINKIGKKNKITSFVGILSHESGKDLQNSFNEGRAKSRDREKKLRGTLP